MLLACVLFVPSATVADLRVGVDLVGGGFLNAEPDGDCDDSVAVVFPIVGVIEARERTSVQGPPDADVCASTA